MARARNDGNEGYVEPLYTIAEAVEKLNRVFEAQEKQQSRWVDVFYEIEENATLADAFSITHIYNIALETYWRRRSADLYNTASILIDCFVDRSTRDFFTRMQFLIRDKYDLTSPSAYDYLELIYMICTFLELHGLAGYPSLKRRLFVLQDNGYLEGI